ncbi:MAG: SDR family NAD(P)-dependent oxidoreductase [Actinobacteria bacterium]|nr:SDR family NAD(P)-dependent oxidoreductase [Actinomycetota bacterium]
MDVDGKVALVTGAANGIGAAVSRRLASEGASVVVADVDDTAGEALAADLGGAYVHCDVREPDASAAAVATAVERFGGLDIVLLNAGVSSGCGVAETFDLAAYRRAMGINLDGVVFGVNAAVPALRARGGGAIVATSSMAGVVPVPLDPVYCANKHAVVGLVRSLGPLLAGDGISVNALCPSFTETAIITGIKPFLEQAGTPILPVESVVEAFMAILDADRTGECWYVVAGRDSAPFEFRRAPGPRL